MAEDDLWSVKNAFYLGCHQQAISEALSAGGLAEPSQTLSKYYMYRAYVEQAQYRMVLDEVQHDAPPALQAVKLLASYLDGGRDAKELALARSGRGTYMMPAGNSSTPVRVRQLAGSTTWPRNADGVRWYCRRGQRDPPGDRPLRRRHATRISRDANCVQGEQGAQTMPMSSWHPY